MRFGLLALAGGVLALHAGHSDRRIGAVIAVAPVGNVPSAALEWLRPVLRDTFDADVLVAPAVPLPANAFNERRRQVHSTRILDALAGVRKPGWERLLGVADVDLYVPELNFVFGEADSKRGVCVFSLARLHAPDEALFHRRAATEAIHELGHTFGLSHCRDPRCVMWFSNTLAESDRKGTTFCPVHTEQLSRARGAPSSHS
jgi:archaemetzincin